MRRTAFIVIAATAFVASCLMAAQSHAAESRPPLIRQSDPVEMPGVGRVVLAFVVTAGIAVAGVYALRRFLPKLGGQFPAGEKFRVVARATVDHGLRLHVVEVSGRTVLVAQGKSGVALTVLPAEESKEAPTVP